MESYDPSRVGAFIAIGGEHIVYAYGDDKVVKFPIHQILFGARFREKRIRDVSICRRYFGDYMLEADVLQTAREKIVMVQPRIRGEHIQARHLKDQKIRREFEELLARGKALTRDGFADVDLIGFLGFFTGQLTNVFVIDDSVKLIDTMLIEIRQPGIFRPFVYVVRTLFVWRQRQVIRAYLSLCAPTRI